MNLELSYPQTYTNTLSEPEFQTWAPIPAVTDYYYNTNTGNVPLVLATTYKIKDFLGTAAAFGYPELRLNIRRLSGSFSSVNWFSVTELPNEGTSAINVVPLENGHEVILTNVLSNLNLLAPGVYTKNIRFQVLGSTPDSSAGEWQVIETHTHQIRLTVSSEAFVWNPTSFNFVHLAGTLPMEEKEITISGSAWQLGLDSRFNVTTDEVSGVTITNIPVINNTLVSGTGTKTIKIALKETFNDETPPAVGNGSWRLSSSETFIANIPFNIALLDISNVIEVNPTVLNFNAVKAILEPQLLFVVVDATIEYVTTNSPWLIVTEGTNEIDGVIKNGFWVVPIPTQNMEPGNYQGFLAFDFEYESEPIQINVEVNYQLFGFIVSPYEENAFTLDSKSYEFNAENDLVYYETVQEIKTFDFFTDFEKIISIPEKFPLYKRKSNFNAGERVHRLMNKFPEPNENYWQYRPAELVITVYEKLIADNTIVRTATLPVQKFVAGLSDNITQPYTFLDVNPNMKRVTKNAVEYLNILMPSEKVVLKTYRNDTLFSEQELLLSFGKIVTKIVTFGEFQQGDVITYKLFNLTDIESTISKTYVVFPEERYSNIVVWENEFLLQSVLQFTGSFASETELNIKSMEKFQNLVEVLDYLEVRKKSKFTLNTGWLLKNDQITVESLMASKRVWIQMPNSSWLSLRPLAKKILNTDSDRELIEYTIEFQLNRPNNAKTYSL
jgi:hypothetical protein